MVRRSAFAVFFEAQFGHVSRKGESQEKSSKTLRNNHDRFMDTLAFAVDRIQDNTGTLIRAKQYSGTTIYCGPAVLFILLKALSSA